MLPRPASPPNGWSDSLAPLFFQQALAVAEADIRKLIHDPFELLTRMVQPFSVCVCHCYHSHSLQTMSVLF